MWPTRETEAKTEEEKLELKICNLVGSLVRTQGREGPTRVLKYMNDVRLLRV